MATKKKKKGSGVRGRGSGKKRPAADSRQPAAKKAPPIPAEELADRVKQLLGKHTSSELGDYYVPDTDYDNALEEVAQAEAVFGLARDKLETAAAPLRAVLEFLDSPRFHAAAAKQHYDEPLKKIVTPLVTKKWDGKSNGAVAWQTLRRSGATDDQVKRNLRNLKPDYSSRVEWEIAVIASGPEKGMKLAYRPPGAVKRMFVLKNEKEVVAAVRRVMGIPAKAEGGRGKGEGKKKAVAKKAAAGRRRKPAVKKKKPATGRRSPVAAATNGQAPTATLQSPPAKFPEFTAFARERLAANGALGGRALRALFVVNDAANEKRAPSVRAAQSLVAELRKATPAAAGGGAS